MGVQVEIAAAQVDKQRLGYVAISLTHYDDDDEPEVTAGSKVEIDGALYEFLVDEAITGWGAIANSTDAFIKVIPAGALCSVEFTDVLPTWNTSKQGWYDGLDRYVAWLRKSSTGAYLYKHLLPNQQGKIAVREVIEIGDWNMDLTGDITITHELAKMLIIDVDVMIRSDDEVYFYPLDGNLGGGEAIGAWGLDDATHVHLVRRTGDFFDGALFDATPYNRGWAYVEHAVLS